MSATSAEQAVLSSPLISVDDHVVEPPHLFEGRMPQNLSDRAPYVKETSAGNEIWVFDGNAYPQVGLNAVAGRSKDSEPMEPLRFDQMRRGCWDPAARVLDMDLGGIDASLNFPSQIAGFCGAVYSGCSDPELGQACVRAWNDWYFEEWFTPHRARFLPLGLTYFAEPMVGAAGIRRNAQRGFVAVSLPEQPQRLGYPTLHSGWWDPIIEACVETGTVVCLHVGSSGIAGPELPLDGPMVEYTATLFSSLSMAACADWLWSGYPARYPELSIVMAEGGLGWVPMLADRLDYITEVSGHGRKAWMSTELSPTDVLLRNFWFCSLDDPSIWPIRDRIGVDHILLEVDYPHADSAWPESRELFADRMADLDESEVSSVMYRNAAKLFRHEVGSRSGTAATSDEDEPSQGQVDR